MKITLFNRRSKAKERAKGTRRPMGFMKRLSADPYADWAIILGGFALFSLSLVAVGIAVYLDAVGALSAPPTAVAADDSARGFDKGALDSITVSFQARAVASQAAAKGNDIPSDPSLP